MKKGRVEECNRGQGKEPVMFRAVQKKKKKKELWKGAICDGFCTT